MALETTPEWVRKLKAKMVEPYTEEELAQVREFFRVIDDINAGHAWPAGTSDRLIELGNLEDDEDERAIAEW